MPNWGTERIMGCRVKDMERWLSEFSGRPDLQFQDSKILIENDQVSITVSIEELPTRQLGLMSFPELRVNFTYPSHQTAAANTWIEAFDRFTQRGGG